MWSASLPMTGPRRWNPQQRPRFHGSVFRYVPHHATNPADGSFAQIHGGHWNPPGTFAVLYTSCSRDVVIANLWRKHEGRAFQPWELAEEDQPDLYELEVDQEGLVDVATDTGIAGVGLPASYPIGVDYTRTQPIGLRLHREQRPGVWCRSAARPTGQEIALFLDYSARPRLVDTPLRLPEWFPVPPGENEA